MKTILQTSLGILGISIMGAGIFWHEAAAQTNADTDRAIVVKGKVAGDWRTWLKIEAHNGKYWLRDGYDPSYTRVVSDYKPLFRKLPTGEWEIMFTSEIAENLP